MTVCKIPGCDRPAKRRGWCGTHYHRWLLKGNPGSNYIRPKRDKAICGTTTGYNQGCRCAPCTEAHRLYTAASDHGLTWDTTTVVTREDVDPDVVRCLCGCGQEWPRHDPDTPAKVIDHLGDTTCLVWGAS